jgi:hypothetical protein
VTDEKGEVLDAGDRAFPEIGIKSDESSINATIEHFWQNCPKALEIVGNSLRMRLFPAQFAAPFELQGGEQKTHHIYLNIGPKSARLNWVHYPLFPSIEPEWYASAGAFSNMAAPNNRTKSPLQTWINEAIEGSNTFFDRREVIDEYGWRNFGDLFADHETYEAVDHPNDKPWVSHYNNQYDVLYGALFQWARSGDPRWFQLANELARHVMDIDIYHTEEDRSAFNGGLFWHTDHFTDAYTATHRGASIKTKIRKDLKSYGSGPAFDHLYSRGLLYYYFMTGDRIAADCVRELALWALRGFYGIRSVAETIEILLRKSLKGIKALRRRASDLNPYVFDGPGRPSGNCLNTFVDAYRLDGDEIYIEAAEQLIRCCVHPDDDIQQRKLLNPNIRWMYTVFLQALIHYMHLKEELGQKDEMYSYARESLLHYVQWMAQNEYPLLSKPKLLDYPNFATRASQDIRKSIIFWYAARYASAAESKSFTDRADKFYRLTVGYLYNLDTRSLTRPLAILMSNTGNVDYFRDKAGQKSMHHNFFPTNRMSSPRTKPQSRWALRFGYLSFKRELFFIHQRIETIVWEIRQRNSNFSQLG